MVDGRPRRVSDPYIYDGYPSEWVHTLENLAQLDAGAIVPGHGPILHDKTYVFLLRDLMKSAVDADERGAAENGARHVSDASMTSRAASTSRRSGNASQATTRIAARRSTPPLPSWSKSCSAKRAYDRPARTPNDS